MQDALGLKKMTAFMADNDLESGTDGESNSRDKRIPKVNAVDVFGARADHEFPAGFVSGEKAFENGSADVRRGPNLRWSRSSLGDRRRLADIVHHLLIVRKVWLALVAQDETRARPITRKKSS